MLLLLAGRPAQSSSGARQTLLHGACAGYRRWPRSARGGWRLRGADGERGGDRRPVGRRGQGQDRRLAVASAPTSSCASRAATTPATRWSSATRPTSCRCCPPASCAPASSASSATAWCSIPGTSSSEIDGLQAAGHRHRPAATCKIAENATLILPLHRELDQLREAAAGEQRDRHHRARHRPGLRGQGRAARHPRPGPQEPRHARRRRSTACSCTTTRCGAGSA